MARILYIVAQGEPLLCGYLKAKVDARSPEGHVVEIKLDERRVERRQESRGHVPERRRHDRRRQPSLDGELGSRGFTSVVVEDEEDMQAPARGPALEPAAGWRPRSTRSQRLGRAWRRRRARWVIRSLALLIVICLLLIVGRSMMRAVPRAAIPSRAAVAPAAPQPATRGEKGEAPPAAAPAATTVGPSSASRPPATMSAASPETPAPALPARASGVVVSVDPRAGVLVMEDMGAAGAEARRLRIRLAPDASVVLSERDPGAGNTGHPFKDTAIGLSDVRPGDFVVVDMREQGGQTMARSVVVTLQARQGSTR